MKIVNKLNVAGRILLTLDGDVLEVNSYVIDGMIMKDIIHKIKITFTSGC